MASKLTKAQQKALAPLTPKRRAFVLAYVGEANGVALRAARMAGYKSPHPEGVRLLQNPTISMAIESLRAPRENKAIKTREDRLAFYSTMMDDEEIAPRDRLRAAELLGKVCGDFIERVQVDDVSGPQVVVEMSAEDVLRMARGEW